MKVGVELPALDIYEVTVRPKFRTSNGKDFFIIGETFFIEFDSAEELAYALIELKEDKPEEGETEDRTGITEDG